MGSSCVHPVPDHIWQPVRRWGIIGCQISSQVENFIKKTFTDSGERFLFFKLVKKCWPYLWVNLV